MAQETEMWGEPMPEPVTLPIGTACPSGQHLTGREHGDHQPLPPLPLPSGSCGTLPRQAIDTGHSRNRPHQWLIAISRHCFSWSWRKCRKEVIEAISTYQDRQKAEARAKVEALAQDLGYSLAELVGAETKTTRAPAAAKYW